MDGDKKLSENEHENDKEQSSAKSSLTEVNKDLSSSGSSFTVDNKEQPSKSSLIQDNKELSLSGSSVTSQDNKDMTSAGSSVTSQDNKELSSSGSSGTPQDNKELSTSGSSGTPQDNKNLSTSGSSGTPQDNKELNISGSSVTSQDNKKLSSSGSSVTHDNKELSTSGSSLTSQDNKEMSSSGSSGTPQDNKELSTSGSSGTPQDNKNLSTSGSSGTPQDNKELNISGSSVTSQDNKKLSSSGSSVTHDNKELSTSGSSLTSQDNKEMSSSGSSGTQQDNKELNSSGSSGTPQDNKELSTSGSSGTPQDNKELNISGSSVTSQDNKKLSSSGSSVTHDNKELSTSGSSLTSQDNKELNSSGSFVTPQDNKELNSSGNSVTQGNNSLSSSGSCVTKDNRELPSFGSFVTGDETINSLKVIACMKGKCLSVCPANKFDHMCANSTATRNNLNEKEFLETGNKKIPEKDDVSLGSLSSCPNHTSLKYEGLSSCSIHSQFSEASEEKKSKVDQSLTRHVEEETCSSAEDSSKDQTNTSQVQHTLKSTSPCNQGNGSHPTTDNELGLLKEGNHIVLPQCIADLLTVEDFQKDMLYIMIKNKQHIDLDLPNCKMIVVQGDIKTIERLLASNIAVVKVPVGETESFKKIVSIFVKNLEQKFSSNVRIRFDDIKHELVIAFHKSIESEVHTLLRELKYESMCLPLPTYMLNYIQLFKKHIFKNIHSYQFQVELLQCMNKNGADHPALKITSERLHFSDILKTVDKILANILLKELQIKPSLARYLQSTQGQEILTLLRHYCHVEVTSPEQQVIMSAVSSQGKKIILCEGNIAATDCHVVILPLQTGQRNLPPVHKLILKRGLISTDLNDIATHVEDLEKPWTLALESNGHAKGQTVVLMQVPELNEEFPHHLVTVCKKALKSVVSMSKTVAMPVRLSEIIPLEKSLEYILQAIRELPEQENTHKTVFLYLDRLSESELKKLTDVMIKTLTACCQNCWETTFWQAKKSCRLQNRVQVIVEDFTAVQADVLVNSTDTKLEHTEGIVSRILLKKAGQGLENQCKSLYPNGIEDNTVLVTDSFELQFAKQVYHIAFNWKWNSEFRNILLKELRWRVQACLMLASSKGYTSIAFPALGTGRLKYPPIEVSQTMFAAASDFFTEMPQSSLKKVFIVCYHQNLEAIKNFKLVETVYNFSLHQKTDKQCEEKVSEGYLEMGSTFVQIVPENCDFKFCDDNPFTKEFDCKDKDQLIQVLKVQGKNLLWMQINLCSFDPKDYGDVVSVLVETVDAKSTNLQNVILIVPDDLVSILISHFEKPYKTSSYLRSKEIKRQVHINHHVPTSLQMVQELPSIRISGTSQNIHHIVAEIEKIQPPVSFEKSMADDGTGSSVDFENGNGKQQEKTINTGKKVHNGCMANLNPDKCTLIIPNGLLKTTNVKEFLDNPALNAKVVEECQCITFPIQFDSMGKEVTDIQEQCRKLSYAKSPEEKLQKERTDNILSMDIDSLEYEAIKQLLPEVFKNEKPDGEKVTVTFDSKQNMETVKEKLSLVRREEISLTPDEVSNMDKSLDSTSEEVEGFIKLLPLKKKVVIICFDYNAMTKAKHLVTVKMGRIKVTQRTKRRFDPGSKEPNETFAHPVTLSASTDKNSNSHRPYITKADFTTKSGIKVSVYKADITQLTVDAIVNAANGNLQHGGGVAAAIANAAGSALELEGYDYVKANGQLQVTDVVPTNAGNLPCQKVLHAVGPCWMDYTDKEQCQHDLEKTVFNSLEKAHSLKFSSLAVSSISSAIFAVPKELCAQMYLAAVQRFECQLGANTTLQHIHFVDINDDMVGIIKDKFTSLWNENVMLPNIHHWTSAIKSSEIGSSLPVTHLSLSSESQDKIDESLMSDDCKKFTAESGIIIYVYKADITQLPVDAIVSMTDSCLNHNSGVAAAVLKVAGQSLQTEEAKYMRERKLYDTEVIMTTAGNLRCKKVLHAVGPIHYNSQSEAEFKDVLGQTIINSLTKAQDQHFASVAFCPMSSAIFHVPKKLCAQVYLTAVLRFEQEHGHNSILQKIHFVDINDDMVDIMKETFSNLWNKPYMPPAFQQSTNETSSYEFQSRTESVKNSLNGAQHIRDMSDLSVPASSKTFTTQSGMTVFVYKANITEVKVDSIVSAADDRLSHSFGVSQAIARAAGQTLYEEGNKYLPKGGRLKVTDVVKTTAGKLPYKFVLHAVGPQYYYSLQAQFKSDLTNTLWNCLKCAHSENITSLAFPSVGSAFSGVPRELCAQVYLETISRFEKEFAGKTNIRYIHFVDIRSEMVKVIQETFDSGWDATVTKSINHPLSDSTGTSLAQGLPSDAQPSAAVVKSTTNIYPIFKDVSEYKTTGRIMIYRYLFQFPVLSLYFQQGDINSTDTSSVVFWQTRMKSLKDEPLKEYLKKKKVNLADIQKVKKIWIDSNSDIEVIPVSPSINVVLSVMPATTMSTDVARTISRILSKIGLKKMPLTIPSLVSTTAKTKGGERGTLSVTQTSNPEVKEFVLGLYTAVEKYSSNLQTDLRELFVTDKNWENIRMMADIICEKIAIDKSQTAPAQNEQANESTEIKSTMTTNVKKCAFCSDEITDPRWFSCKHEFCISCFSDQWQNTCPLCSNVQQKYGTMCMQYSFKHLAGFDKDNSFEIVYNILSGTEMSSQNVKKNYDGKVIKAYLPDTLEGRRVLMLLKVAFDRELIFILRKSGSHMEIAWNGIEHKTQTSGGLPKYGYPDRDYLSRVQQELRAKGVTEKDLTEKQKVFIETPRQILTPFNSDGDFSYLFNV